MEDPLIESTLQALQKNKFNAYLAESPQEANRIFFEKILPTLQVRTYTWGDSMTMRATGVLEELGKQSDKVPILTFDASFSQTQKIYWRKQALLADLFLTGTNALTQKGQLVNLDMIGNRIGGINFGPENVVIFAGINKMRFRRPVIPGDVMRLEVKLTNQRAGIYFADVCATVEGEVAARGEIMCALMDPQK